MSGKAVETAGEHGPALREGLSTALSWLTVLPFAGATVFDRTTGRRAMAAIPVPGLVLGLAAAAISTGATLVGFAPLLTAVLCVVSWELLTRMMHIDGLADVGDALGSYASPERAREIIADRYTGALGMGAVLLTLGVQVAALSDLLALPSASTGILLIGVIPALSRMSAMIGCSRLFRPFSTGGFGAMIIGTVPLRWIGLWWLALTTTAGVLAAVALPGVNAWAVTGGVAVAGVCGIGFTLVLARHLNHRLGGLNGDCMGALIETSTAVCALTALVVVRAAVQP
ncbi:adenosylcobinamide-GDP ribazoletransferase [Corynebacterium sp. CCM 9185]|uniref:Adenosylcobinamide-GDP ribazoletransferase n=1 Tax=Corynebacterium marambiense TaxID=2765364 RepID=A0ABS0VZS1_9CORY|nr:adenosylcobinamide-GDP ribazoletransferase [Corynebacterium marambiense]MBI9000903.1 adenosylcobinamide-GDP ribazoletransferase [Corynebacterium marambiense]MCK7662829.1 adenosylcobinamide-GDP ribazoletransferase [Corynebacterium marambiense]MCX7542438.1 adenosylcobinamide-GDP ribazoletransferase [Corynebacterium marambiense]